MVRNVRKPSLVDWHRNWLRVPLGKPANKTNKFIKITSRERRGPLPVNGIEFLGTQTENENVQKPRALDVPIQVTNHKNMTHNKI